MEEFDLGPNGGLVYCMEYLLSNFSWLEDKLKQLGSQYVLFDCPGQVSKHFFTSLLFHNYYTTIIPLFHHYFTTTSLYFFTTIFARIAILLLPLLLSYRNCINVFVFSSILLSWSSCL